MKIIGLDLSTKRSGFGIFNKDSTLLEYGVITASSTDVIKRIYKITKELKEVFDKHPEIEIVLLEEVRPEVTNSRGVGNIHTQKMLMWLQAAVAFMLHDNFPNVKIEYVYPSEWRKKCGIHTGRGVKRDTLKIESVNFVNTKFNLDTKDNDLAEGIAIGYSYFLSSKAEDEELNWG